MNYKNQKGFTLIEMVAVLGIFGIVTSVVMFNHSKFQSDTVLTNMAYEIALSIREAQVYGVSAREAKQSMQSTSENFSKAYGVYIPKANSSQYLLFADLDNNLKYSGTDCGISQASDSCVMPYTLQRNIIIESMYVKNNQSCILADNMSILFKRPNPEPIINTGGNRETFSQLQITVKAPDGAKRYVIVSNNGQISVENNQICPA